MVSFAPKKDWDRKCEKCGITIVYGQDVYWLKNYTRNELYCYCEKCANNYTDMIKNKGGSVEVESIHCRTCGCGLHD